MASRQEITDAVDAARDAGQGGCALLHCVSGYPTPVEEANLSRIPALARDYDMPIGLSDHTLGIDVPITSVALSAAIIEKHVTLARADGGPDAEFSLEPDELKAMILGVRAAFSALGTADYGRASSEKGNVVFRRSLYAVKDIAAGERLTDNNVRSIRPGHGLAPKHLPDILGRHATKPIKRGTPISLEQLAKD